MSQTQNLPTRFEKSGLANAKGFLCWHNTPSDSIYSCCVDRGSVVCQEDEMLPGSARYGKVGDASLVAHGRRGYAVRTHYEYGVYSCRDGVCELEEVQRVYLAAAAGRLIPRRQEQYPLVPEPVRDSKIVYGVMPFIVAPELAYPLILKRLGFFMSRLSPEAVRPRLLMPMPEALLEVAPAAERLVSLYMNIVAGVKAELPPNVSAVNMHRVAPDNYDVPEV